MSLVPLPPALLWLAVTLACFWAADRVSLRTRRHPLAHPVLLAAPVLIGLLLATGTPYRAYADATAMLTFLLGPATVALAAPLWAHRRLVRRVAVPLAAALLAGSLTAIASAVAILSLFGAPREILASIAPRAATTPVAMAIAAQIGGIPSLAAAIVLLSGIVGAIAATPLFDRLGFTDVQARGFAAGVAAHGFGTARAFQVSEVAGAFAGIGLALNAAMTSLVLSLAGWLLR